MPELDYEAPPTLCDVSVLRDAYHARVVVPPLPTWRLLSRGIILAVVALGMIVLSLLSLMFGTLLRGQLPPDVLPGLMSNLVIYGLALAAAIAVAYSRLHRWTTFTVTAGRLLLNRRIGSREGTTTSWPRGRITQVKANPWNGKLAIRRPNEDLLEVFVSPNPAVVKRVAREINDALASSFEQPPHSPATTPAPVTQAAVAPVVGGRRFAEILTITGCAAVFVSAIFFPPLFLVFVIAAVPLGIWLGTQKKDYYC